MPILRQLIRVVHGDLQQLDVSSASVIVLYLLPESVILINDMLIRAIRSGCVLICNTVSIRRYHCIFFKILHVFPFDEISGVRKL